MVGGPALVTGLIGMLGARSPVLLVRYRYIGPCGCAAARYSPSHIGPHVDNDLPGPDGADTAIGVYLVLGPILLGLEPRVDLADHENVGIVEKAAATGEANLMEVCWYRHAMRHGQKQVIDCLID